MRSSSALSDSHVALITSGPWTAALAPVPSWPALLSPQHHIAVSSSIAQVWRAPPSTAVHDPPVGWSSSTGSLRVMPARWTPTARAGAGGTNLKTALGGGAGLGASLPVPTAMPASPGPASWLRLEGGPEFGCGLSSAPAPNQVVLG